MAILIDANVIIEAERGSFDLFAWIESRPDEEFQLAAITIAELWHGVERAAGTHRTKREKYLRRVFGVFPVLAYTEATAMEHARLWAQLESKGQYIGDYDLILAASALHTGATVATFNRRHFDPVKGLTVIEPRKNRRGEWLI